MRSKAQHHHHLAPLTLAFLLTGLLGCSNGSEARQGETAKPAAQGQAQPAQGQAAQPQGQTQGQPPAAPGQPAPGAAAQAAPTPEPKVDPEKLPAVVAKVNGQDIKKADLLEEAKQLRGQFLQRGARPEMLDGQTFYRQVLDGVIARTLLESEARAAGVAVTDEDVQKEITTLRGQFPSPEIFDKAMAAQGLDEAKLKENLKRQLLVKKFVEAKVLKGDPTEQEVKVFYDQNQEQMKQPERVHLRHILVKADAKAPEADKQKARAKAEALLARAKGGEDFAKLASENSDDPGSKQRGGDLDWVVRGQTVEPFEKAAFALQKPNELSPVVETQYGYHVIQLLERKPAEVMPFEQVKERIGTFLKQRQSQDQFQAHLKELRAKAKVEVFI
jgi:peptidyl-prolyl cis-trans isomerase C